MPRSLTLLIVGLFSVTILSAAFLLDNSPVSAAPIAGAPTTYCADPGTDPSMDTGAGTMIRCVTQITNTITAIDPVSGVASGTAHVKVTECRGPANGRLSPADLTCTVDEQDLVQLVTRVYQCNGVGYGGGNVLECSVDVTTNFVGVSPQAILAATVNQCVGSAPVTTGCNPFPATTDSATITQCNGSSYGGGQEDFNCIATGTTSASLSVTVNQCNGSNYGGGSWLNCSAALLTNVVPLAPTPTPTLAATPTLAPTPTAAATPRRPRNPAPTATATTRPRAVPTPTAVATPRKPRNAAPTATATTRPHLVPTPTLGMPDSSTGPQPTPPHGESGIPLLVIIGMFILAIPAWKLYTDRGARVR